MAVAVIGVFFIVISGFTAWAATGNLYAGATVLWGILGLALYLSAILKEKS